MKKMDMETLVGGVASIIATFAIFSRLLVDGISTVTVIDSLIEFSGLVVTIMILVVALRRLRPRTIETFDKTLVEGLDKWVRRSRPLIYPEDSTVDIRKTRKRYKMLVKHDSILMSTEMAENFDDDYDEDGDNDSDVEDDDISDVEIDMNKRSTKIGVFVSLPSVEELKKGDALIEFWLNKGTFKRRMAAYNIEKQNELTERNLLASRMAACIASNYKFSVAANPPDTDEAKIKIIIEKQMSTPDDAREIINLIEYVMKLYLCVA